VKQETIAVSRLMRLANMSELDQMCNAHLLPPPSLLARAIPLLEEDFSSGEVGRLLQEVGSTAGMSHLKQAELMEVVAAGMGYVSWDAMVERKGDVAGKQDLPHRLLTVIEVIAWRMFRTGKVGLRQAYTGISAGLKSTALGLRKIYGDFGYLSTSKSGEVVRRAALHAAWSDMKFAEMMPNGRVRLQWAGEMAWCAATVCWTEDCGISEQEILQEIARGSELEVDELINDSWMYTSSSWPTGLRPLQYNDEHGRLVGYGWAWDELGIRSATVFGSTEAFKKSAVALWQLQPASQFGLKTLPKTLIEVDFRNPWDPRDWKSTQSAGLKAAIAREQVNKDTTPWMEVHKTDGARIQSGRQIELAGDVWTGPVRSAPKIEGLLGLTLPTMAEVKAQGHEITWLLEKVPLSIDQEAYESVCRIFMAADELQAKEDAWLKTREAEIELSGLLKRTAEYKHRGISARSAAIMEEPTGHVAEFEVPMAGESMKQVYPELDSLSAAKRGEYALGFYGKNGIRHDRKHTVRDPAFMEYAILRNVGVDVNAGYETEHLFLARLLRTSPDARWYDQDHMAKVAEDARQVLLAFTWAKNLLNELDQSMDDSRLKALGLCTRQASD
jgi:hypothetical protein